ncbi:MAG: glycosyltransferase family 4 protein [Phycisphaerae bacterium]|nr:glycosyltransferase family 4 protein [Phycisphaerae bacterium]
MSKIFGTLGLFETTNSDGDIKGMRLGAKLAGIGFDESLIQYGDFDCHHFLLGRGKESDEDIAEYIRSKGWDPQKILIYDGALPLDRLKKNNYHVIHKTDIELNQLLAIRHFLGHPLAPGTVMTHSISYAKFMPLWTEMLCNHLLPCDAIVCTSRAGREVLERSMNILTERFSSLLGMRVPTFRGRMEVIPLGVDVDYWKPAENKVEFRELLGLPAKACIILCPGRISTHDKMDLRPFLIALSRLTAVLGTDFFHVVLAGDDMRTKGKESKLIQEFVNEHGLSSVVKIDTNVGQATMRQYYGAADIFVSLADNIQETFGLTVIQAMACGLPTIVSDWDGYKETVVHGETGVRVPTYWAQCDAQAADLSMLRPWTLNHLLIAQSVAVDVDALYHALYMLVTDPEGCRHLGEAGRKRAEELYAWPCVIKQYMALWDECRDRFDHIDVQEWACENRENIFAPAYFRQFAHYPSALITSETQLCLLSEDSPMDFAHATTEVQLPPEMRPVFHPAVFQGLLSRLRDWPISFGALVEDTSRETGQPQDLCARHVLWLIKYGMVKPLEPKLNSHSVIAEIAQAKEKARLSRESMVE